MHGNLTTTDGTYGILSENDVKKQIADLRQKILTGDDEKLSVLISVAKQLEQLLREQGIVN